MINTLKDLQEKRVALIDRMDAILATAKKENRDLSDKEESEFDDYKVQLEKLDKNIDREKLVEERKKNLAVDVKPVDFATPGKAALGNEEVKNAKRYSLSKAVSAVLNGRSVEGLEREVNEAAASEARGFSNVNFAGQIQLPSFMVDIKNAEKRDLDITTEGGDVKQTTLQGLIPLLTIDPLIGRLVPSSNIYRNLNGDLQFPKETAGSTVGWSSTENASITESTPTMGNVQLAPKRLGVYVEASKKFLIQSSFNADQYLRSALERDINIKLDSGYINGSGASGEPTGILNTSGVNTIDHGASGGAPTWALVNQFIRDVQTANAMSTNMAWVSNPKVRYKMKTTAKVSSTDSVMIMNSDGELVGYPFFATNNMPSNFTETTTNLSGAIFGDFSQAYLGFWSGVDLVVDPYSKAEQALVRFIANMWADIALRQPAAFSIAKDIITT
jgi:HK97 family phage major capsid protein